jgi:hypothetical protein
MPKGLKGQKRPADVIGNAIRVARIATGEAEEEFDPGRRRQGSSRRRHGPARRQGACRADDPGAAARGGAEGC